VTAGPFKFTASDHGRYVVVDRATGETLGWVRRRSKLRSGYYGDWEYWARGGKTRWSDSRQSAAVAMKRELDNRRA
jgi:hypothetical protein